MNNIPRRILGLDPAALTGWCWCDGETRDYGTVRFALPSDVHPGDRLVRALDWLTRFLAKRPCDLVAYEDAHRGSHNPDVQAMHAELRCVIKIAACDPHLPCVGLNPMTIKKFATGSGNAKKDQMLAACERFYGITGIDDNAADAIFIEALARQNAAHPAAFLPKKQLRRQRRRAAPSLF